MTAWTCARTRRDLPKQGTQEAFQASVIACTAHRLFDCVSMHAWRHNPSYAHMLSRSMGSS